VLKPPLFCPTTGLYPVQLTAGDEVSRSASQGDHLRHERLARGGLLSTVARKLVTNREAHHRKGPVRIGGFVAPVKQSRHNPGVSSSAAKCLHGAFILPRVEGPESPPRVDQQAPTAESGGAHDLDVIRKQRLTGDLENLSPRVHCTFCSRAISFCGKVSSDSDHKRREVARVFISIFFVNSSSRRTFSRIRA
jgi:hypothetical protein